MDPRESWESKDKATIERVDASRLYDSSEVFRLESLERGPEGAEQTAKRKNRLRGFVRSSSSFMSFFSKSSLAASEEPDSEVSWGDMDLPPWERSRPVVVRFPDGSSIRFVVQDIPALKRKVGAENCF